MRSLEDDVTNGLFGIETMELAITFKLIASRIRKLWSFFYEIGSYFGIQTGRHENVQKNETLHFWIWHSLPKTLRKCNKVKLDRLVSQTYTTLTIMGNREKIGQEKRSELQVSLPSGIAWW